MGLVSPGLRCPRGSGAEQGGTTSTQPESRGGAEGGDRGPSVRSGYSVPHFSTFPGDGRPALQIHIPQIPGEGTGTGTTRDATASKPVTQPRRVIPGLLIIDLEWEETGSGLAGQTRM